jgi:hypothetical protein
LEQSLYLLHGGKIPIDELIVLRLSDPPEKETNLDKVRTIQPQSF